MRKKVDNRIRVLIENCVATKHRSMFVVVGKQAKDQVVILHHMLSKTAVKARPTVLWCYKKELGFSSDKKKRMRELQKKIQSGLLSLREDDPFEMFVAATNIRYCYYNETHKILGNTYGMCVLQDFEALSPNLLARTVETVEGGGIVVLLLRSVASLKQLYTMTMDVHSRYRTEAHQDVVARFNERFILSLAACRTCMVIDDQLNILPLSSHMLTITPVPPKSAEEGLTAQEQELRALKESLQDTQPVGVLVNCCRTLDQGKAVLKFIEAISEKTLRATAVLTAARGRGKSAALGLAMASAVAFGYSNIFVTAPSPENLKTMFDFVFKGFDALQYQEHLDYELVQSTNPEFNNAIVRVNIFREHRQTIQYIHPGDAHKLGQAELVCIDEAAAIPLPLVRSLLGPYLVFMSSTINGYEGTGRSLSLKLIGQLRQQNSTMGAAKKSAARAKQDAPTTSGRVLHEVALSESIRYASGDPVEQWLYDLLCLDASNVSRIISGCPVPSSCELYYVNRDTLFSYHRASEAFLHRLMALYVSSHYKNSPNDLQMLSDAPAHHIFCLLGPVSTAGNTAGLPEVLTVLQVCLEGDISKATIMNSLSRGQRASGDLIPWTVTQQFQDPDFGSLSGARVVRIATHPDYQSMGYGSRALELLQRYYEGGMPSLEEAPDTVQQEAENVTTEEVSQLLTEHLVPRKKLPPLLLKLSERRPERLDYLGVSYGLTGPLLKFWKRNGYTPVYLRQTPNDLTGEHSCIMLKRLRQEEEGAEDWLRAYWTDFRRRFLSLLSYQFRAFTPQTCLAVLQQKHLQPSTTALSREELLRVFTTYDLKRLELYGANMADFHLVMDLIPALARLDFLGQLGNISLNPVQAAVLLGMGLQHKTPESVAGDLELSDTQVLGFFNKTVKKCVQVLSGVQEAAVEQQMVARREIDMKPVFQPLHQELSEAAVEAEAALRVRDKALLGDLSQYAIKGSETDWESATAGQQQKLGVSIKSFVERKRKAEEAKEEGTKKHKKHKNKGKHGGGKK